MEFYAYQKGVIFILSQKKKKWIVLVSVLFCLMLSTYFSVIRFSSTNVENVIEDRETVSVPAEELSLDEEKSEAVVRSSMTFSTFVELNLITEK